MFEISEVLTSRCKIAQEKPNQGSDQDHYDCQFSGAWNERIKLQLALATQNIIC
jgi:hypothetical protein